MAPLWHHHAHSDPVDAPSETNVTKGRTLVMCFDGTNECYDAQNTNIVKLFSLLKKDDPSRQLVYYQVRRVPGWRAPVLPTTTTRC